MASSTAAPSSGRDFVGVALAQDSPRPTSPRVPRDDYDPTHLPAALAHRKNDELQWVARVFTSKPPTNKHDLAELLLSQTCLPGLRRTLELAGVDGRKVLALAAHGNGLLRTAQAAVPGFALGAWQRTWDSTDKKKTSPSVVLLFFPDDLSMPPTLRQRLAALLPAPPRPPLKALAGNPPGEHLGGDALADLGLVLESARAGQLQLTTIGLSTPSLRRLTASLSCPSRLAGFDMMRWRCLTRLLTASGWLRQTAKRLETGRREPNRHALQTLFHAYRDWQHDELHDLPGLRGTHDEYAPISEPIARRRALLQALGRCPVGAWMDFDGFVCHAAATEAIEPILDDECRVSIGRDYGGSMAALGEAGLAAVRNAWMRLVLACYLAPLGVVEVSLDRLAKLPPIKTYDYEAPNCISLTDRVVAFRLTPLGAWLLGVGTEPAAVTVQPGGWRIQADGSVVSLGERVPSAERVLLDRIAERLDERSWRLERSRLIAAIAGGDKPEALRARLTKLSGNDLPDTVGRLLDDAGRRATAVQVEAQLIVLAVTDPLARDQLLHDRSTKELCLDCGGSLVGVPPTDLAALRRAARKLGWHIPEHHVS